jgi:hypothetical protein
MAGLMDIVGGILKPLTDVIEHFSADATVKAQLAAAAYQSQIMLGGKMLDYETQLLQAQQASIVAEASGGNFLQRSWRPILMLTFGGLIVARWLGWTAPNITPDEMLELWGIVKIGLGGYVVGRSVEKIAPSIVQTIKATRS